MGNVESTGGEGGAEEYVPTPMDSAEGWRKEAMEEIVSAARRQRLLEEEVPCTGSLIQYTDLILIPSSTPGTGIIVMLEHLAKGSIRDAHCLHEITVEHVALMKCLSLYPIYLKCLDVVLYSGQTLLAIESWGMSLVEFMKEHRLGEEEVRLVLWQVISLLEAKRTLCQYYKERLGLRNFLTRTGIFKLERLRIEIEEEMSENRYRSGLTPVSRADPPRGQQQQETTTVRNVRVKVPSVGYEEEWTEEYGPGLPSSAIFAPPEIFDPSSDDCAFDIDLLEDRMDSWGLGILLYFCLTGRHPLYPPPPSLNGDEDSKRPVPLALRAMHAKLASFSKEHLDTKSLLPFDENAIDLIRSALVRDPAKRISLRAFKAHPFMDMRQLGEPFISDIQRLYDEGHRACIDSAAALHSCTLEDSSSSSVQVGHQVIPAERELALNQTLRAAENNVAENNGCGSHAKRAITRLPNVSPIEECLSTPQPSFSVRF